MVETLEIFVRLANPPGDLVARYTSKEREFFFGYADHILQLLKAPQVQQQLRHLLEIENMEFRKAVDLRIMAFPARPLHGRPRNILHGSYNHDSAQISMYPLKVKRDWIRQEGFSTFNTPAGQLSSSQLKMLREISVSAITTLIHEVLHVKFENRGLSRYAEEAIVRKLEKQYAHEWMSNLPVGMIEKFLPMSPTH
jgi:hypothetical protein